ncbi:MAG TPA: hypothetical protein VLV86_03450 [Vicinamibacterales bacterium]|nr:hypothetical protein [Vicinamibacterales bacterium]
MCDINKLVEEAVSKGGQNAQVHEGYDAALGTYHGNVQDHRVKEPAAKPRPTQSPFKVGGM